MISKAFLKKILLKSQNIPSHLAFQAFCLKNRKEAAIIKSIIGLTYLDNKTLSELIQVVIDDYYHYQGCKDAVDTYFRDKQPQNYRFIKKSRLHIVKV